MHRILVQDERLFFQISVFFFFFLNASFFYFSWPWNSNLYKIYKTEWDDSNRANTKSLVSYFHSSIIRICFFVVVKQVDLTITGYLFVH